MIGLTPAKLDVLFNVAGRGAFTAEDIGVSGSLLRAMWLQGFLTADRDGRPIIYRISDDGRAYVRLATAPVNPTDREGPVAHIQKLVARHFRISVNEMTSDRRGRVVARPRQVAMYVARQATPKSLPQIGRLFGNRDHTTVLHAVRKVESMMSQDNAFAHQVEALLEECAA